MFIFFPVGALILLLRNKQYVIRILKAIGIFQIMEALCSNCISSDDNFSFLYVSMNMHEMHNNISLIVFINLISCIHSKLNNYN